MASDNVGKIRPNKRSKPGNKPYDRNTSLFGKITSTVKDLLIPSFLVGGSSESATKEESPDKLVSSNFHGGVPNVHQQLISEGRLNSGETRIQNQSQPIMTRPNTGLELPRPEIHHLSSRPLDESTRLGSYLDETDNEGTDNQPMKQLMLSTGSFSRTPNKPALKKQRLWSPESARQGKPMVPPSTDKPGFNSFLFGSLNKSDTTLFGDSFGESSFYSGRTRYGGAAAERNRSMNKSLPYQSSLPLRKQVKANKSKEFYQATTSATSQRILETLDRMSTPLGDAKKIPRADPGNDSLLSFTPSSYRRASLLGLSRSATRPLQLPSKGPPTSQYQASSQAVIAKNRYQSSEISTRKSLDDNSNREAVSKTQFSITQESLNVHEPRSENLVKESEVAGSSGKMKTKKFSQHISSKIDVEEVAPVPNLRTDFTLPVSSMKPITFQNMPSKSIPVARTNIPTSTVHSDVSPLKFTFSTPIQEKPRPADQRGLNGGHKDFTFSSPIKASSSKKSAAGAEEGSKSSPEPAVGASSVVSCGISALPAWGSTAPKPKASSPDIGGTSSSFMSYSKWGSNKNDMSAASESPGFSFGPAASLRTGSVMDILGGGKSSASASSACNVSKTEDLMAKFTKPAGSWECDSCMVQNKTDALKCVCCETCKPGSKKLDAPVSKPSMFGAQNTGSQGSDDLLAKFKKPTDSWDCDTCMLVNKSDATKCVACETPRPGTKSLQPTQSGNGGDKSLSQMFKAPSGSWECDTCMVQNKSESTKCVACETPKPGSKSASVGSNSNSLSSMFKKPTGSWECDTCMVNNSSTALRCVACESPKPGLQTAGVVAKSPVNGPDTTTVKINPGGGFSINIPMATTEGSGGFKFGNTDAATTASSGGFKFGGPTTSVTSGGFSFGNTAATSTVASGGFKFGNTSVSTSSFSNSTTTTAVFGQTSVSKNPESSAGGFKFDTNTPGVDSKNSTPSQPLSGGFTFGAPASGSLPSSSDTKGFQFGTGNINSQESSLKNLKPEGSSLTSNSAVNDTSLNKSNSAVAPVTLGFQFGSGELKNGPISKEDNSSKNTPVSSHVDKLQAASFSFGAASNLSSATTGLSSKPTVNLNSLDQSAPKPAPGLFSFGASAPGAPSNTSIGLGMNKSLSDVSKPPQMVNGGFGTKLQDNGAQDGPKPFSGFGTTTPATQVFSFGQSASTVQGSAPNSAQLTSNKRSVDSTDSNPSVAKKSFGVAPGNSETTQNGLFSFGGPSAAPGGFSFGGSAPVNQTNSLSAPGGGFQFGAASGFAASSTNPAPAASGFGFSGKAAETDKGFNFSTSSTPSFNFGAPNQTAPSSAPFQFGGKAPEVSGQANTSSTGMFQFGGAPALRPAASAPPQFGAASATPAPGGIGSFNIGASDASRRTIKKAVRRTKK